MSYLDKLLQGVEVEWKALWEVTIWDKRFNGVDKAKQSKINSFKHVSAAELKKLSLDNGNVKLLATGKFDGTTTKELAGKNLNNAEVITIPSGGTANLKYFNGYFVDNGNILTTSINNEKFNLRYIYFYLLNINDIIQGFFRGSGVAHPSMSEIL